SWLRDSCSFFFSSRSRHTRFSRDWSSDVCSSDLEALMPSLCSSRSTVMPGRVFATTNDLIAARPFDLSSVAHTTTASARSPAVKIGRASRRERGAGEGRGATQYVDDGPVARGGWL